MDKNIVGLIGDKILIKKIENYFKENKYEIFSLMNKVKDISSYLLHESEINNDIVIRKIKEKGIKIHKSYWINMLIMSIPSEVSNILIVDMDENDVIPIIKVFRITSSNFYEVEKEIIQLFSVKK